MFVGEEAQRTRKQRIAATSSFILVMLCFVSTLPFLLVAVFAGFLFTPPRNLGEFYMVQFYPVMASVASLYSAFSFRRGARLFLGLVGLYLCLELGADVVNHASLLDFIRWWFGRLTLASLVMMALAYYVHPERRLSPKPPPEPVSDYDR